MFKKVILALFLLSLMGCAGTGLEKKMTAVPDQVKLEWDTNPQNDWAVHEITGGVSWNLK
jgi:hypothetical protein